MQNLTRTFIIEWKMFQLERNQDYVVISERGGRRVNTVTIHREVAEWISRKLPDSGGDLDIPIARMQKNDLTVSLMPRQNQGGIFMSILFVSRNLKKGSRIICVPLDEDKTGWKIFKSQCKEICQVSNVDVVNEPMGGTNQVLVKNGYEDKVELMREKCIMVTTEIGAEWWHFPSDLNDIFNLSKIPVINQVGVRKFMLQMGSDKDVMTILKVPKVILAGREVSFSRWSPKESTLDISWIQKIDRWIEVVGLPIHLRETTVLNKICENFGKIIKVTNGTSESSSSIKVFVQGCDLTNMPQVMILNDQSIVSPIRLLVCSNQSEESQPGREEEKLEQPENPLPLPQNAWNLPAQSLHVSPTLEISNFPTIEEIVPSNQPSSVDNPNNRLKSIIVIPDFVRSPPNHIETSVSTNPIISHSLPIPLQTCSSLPPQSTTPTFKPLSPINSPCLHVASKSAPPILNRPISFTNTPTANPSPSTDPTSVDYPNSKNMVALSPRVLTQSDNSSSDQDDGRFTWAVETESSSSFDYVEGIPNYYSGDDEEGSLKTSVTMDEVTTKTLGVSMQLGLLKKGENDLIKTQFDVEAVAQDEDEEDEDQDNHCGPRVTFTKLIRNMEEGARTEVAERETVQDLTVQASSSPIFNFAGNEYDGLVSDSGDDSSHCPENLEDQVEIVQSEDVANLISKSMSKIKDLLKINETNSVMMEPTFTKKGRKRGSRSDRRRTRAALLLQAEELN